MYFNRRAEAGIGTLIMFIALILVVAIAAGVLIQTSSSLQSKALFTGSKAQAQVSSQAVAIALTGEDASTSAHTLNVSFLKLKLAPGSDAISLSSSLLEVDTTNARSNLQYSSTINCSDQGIGPGALLNTTTSTQYYGARYLIGTNTGYIERSSIVELCFALPEVLVEGRSIKVSFIPKIGSRTVVETKAPEVMLTKRVQLFP